MKTVDGYIKLFRTHEEMEAVYQERDKKGLRHPIVNEYKSDSQLMIFFGSSHENKLDSHQWSLLDAKWKEFLDNPNTNKMAIIEPIISSDQVVEKSREEVITNFSEGGYTLWLAQQARIECIWGEPSREEGIFDLKTKYTNEQIMVYYFARQMLQWVTQDFRTRPDWRPYIKHMLQKYSELEVWGEEFNLDEVIGWYEKATGKKFGPQDKPTFYDLSAPTTNEVSSFSSKFRDKHLFGIIIDAWQKGRDIFITYGSGHAIVMEPAIKELIEQYNVLTL